MIAISRAPECSLSRAIRATNHADVAALALRCQGLAVPDNHARPFRSGERHAAEFNTTSQNDGAAFNLIAIRQRDELHTSRGIVGHRCDANAKLGLCAQPFRLLIHILSQALAGDANREAWEVLDTGRKLSLSASNNIGFDN